MSDNESSKQGETRGTRTFQQADCPKCRARITVEVLGLGKPLAPEATTKEPTFYIWKCITCGARIQTTFDIHINARPICCQCNAEFEQDQAIGVAPGEAVGRETREPDVEMVNSLIKVVEGHVSDGEGVKFGKNGAIALLTTLRELSTLRRERDQRYKELAEQIRQLHVKTNDYESQVRELTAALQKERERNG